MIKIDSDEVIAIRSLQRSQSCWLLLWLEGTSLSLLVFILASSRRVSKHRPQRLISVHCLFTVVQVDLLMHRKCKVVSANLLSWSVWNSINYFINLCVDVCWTCMQDIYLQQHCSGRLYILRSVNWALLPALRLTFTFITYIWSFPWYCKGRNDTTKVWQMERSRAGEEEREEIRVH